MNDSEFEDWIFEEYSQEAETQFSALPEHVRDIMSVYLVHYPILNGGFRYLFEMDLTVSVTYQMIVTSFRNVGLVDLADHFEKVLRLFPGSTPHSEKEMRNDFLAKYFEAEDDEGNENEDYSAIVDAAERAYYKQSKNINSVLHKYYNLCSA